MLVTLKLEYIQLAIRHNLNLYNNATAFSTLINLLEAYRLERLKLLIKKRNL